MQLLLAAADPLEEVLPHALFHIGPIAFTNHMFMALVAGALMIWIFPKLFAQVSAEPPTGAKNFFESILEFLRIEVFRPALKDHTDKFVPFLWSLFFFILFCNVLGCIPLAAIFALITGGHVEHLGGAATGNISTTAALAICAFFFIHFNGISQIVRDLMNGTYGHHGHHADHSCSGEEGHESAYDLPHARAEGLAADVPGDFRAIGNPSAHYADGDYPNAKQAAAAHAADEHKKMGMGQAIALAIPLYLWNFAPHPFKPEKGESNLKWALDFPIFLMLLLLELLGALIKPFALCMRLFANMVAGHVMLAVLISLIVAVPVLVTQIAIGVPLGILDFGIQLLEVFVAFLQAYIFTFLTTLFIASAVAPEH